MCCECNDLVFNKTLVKDLSRKQFFDLKISSSSFTTSLIFSFVIATKKSAKHRMCSCSCFHQQHSAIKIKITSLKNVIFLSLDFNQNTRSVVKQTLLVRKVWGSITGTVKSAQCRQRLATAQTFLQSCIAQALSHGDGPRYSLHASAQCREYNEDLIFFRIIVPLR